MSLDPNDPRQKTQARASYGMPPAAIGPCVWRPNPSEPDVLPAVITGIGDRSVMLSVFAPDNRGNLPQDGVRHISDPELSDNPDRKSGCWDYTPDQVRLQVAEQLVNQLLDETTRLRVEFDTLKTAIGA